MLLVLVSLVNGTKTLSNLHLSLGTSTEMFLRTMRYFIMWENRENEERKTK
jgi:hypothetical protein